MRELFAKLYPMEHIAYIDADDPQPNRPRTITVTLKREINSPQLIDVASRFGFAKGKISARLVKLVDESASSFSLAFSHRAPAVLRVRGDDLSPKLRDRIIGLFAALEKPGEKAFKTS